MKYIDIATYNLQHNLCPFCSMPQNFMIEKSNHFFVTYNRAPYIKNHLLIIPIRHVVLFNSLLREEIQDLMQLISKRTDILHKNHDDITLLLRDGFIGGKCGKSVNHMHFHLIPDMEIGSMGKSGGMERKYLTEKELLKRMESIKKIIK